MAQSATRRSREQRTTDRFATALPVRIDDRPGETHNISAQGIYFETDASYRVGSLVNFTVEYKLHGQTQRLQCEGKVIRVEPHGDRIGVAARLVAPFFVEDGAAQTRG